MRARAAAVALAAGDDRDELAHGPRILGALRDLFGNAETVTTAHLLDRLNHDEELPYGAWSDGRGIGARDVAKLLRPYGVRPRSVRLADGSTPKGYRRGNQAVEDAFARYVADHPPHATNVADQTSRYSRVVADVADVAANPGKGESEGPGAPDEALATAGEEAEGERLTAKYGGGPERSNGDDPLADLAPEAPLPNPAANAQHAATCRCDRPVRETDEDGEPQCARCGHAMEPTCQAGS